MSMPPDDHRPWPTPPVPWVLFMRWRHLAFLHWPVPADELRRLVPEALELGTYGGQAWLGITPFEMNDVRARFTPPVPGVSSFPELNVRTYVSHGGKPGIWFLSLDAASALAVRAARRFFHLPYRRARMSIEVQGSARVEYRSERTEGEEPEARFHARYRPTGPARRADPGSLEHWLTERYCLYSQGRRHLYRGEIHHAPWSLHPAEAEILSNTMTQPFGIDITGPPALVHTAEALDVVGWILEPVG